MSGPSLADVRALAGQRVRVVVPKPREDQRVVGTVVVDGRDVRLRVGGGSVRSDRFGTLEFRERDGDGVLQAVRGDGRLVGRVTRVSPLEAE